MTIDVDPGPSVDTAPFCHEALLYEDRSAFLEGTLSFIEGGFAADESMLVVLTDEKNEMLKSELGARAASVQFADMAEVGANPARIIPAWRRFADGCEAQGRAFRGIGEPIWAERSVDELVECQRHESLLNLAFADTRAFRLLCPYDTRSLGTDVVEEAHRSHASMVHGAHGFESGTFRDLDAVAAPFDSPLPEPLRVLDEFVVERGSLGAIRSAVVGHAIEAALRWSRTEDLVAAVNEIATNTLVHGGGRGRLRIWRQENTLVCEARDSGQIDDPMAGRVVPPEDREGGRGLWLANQLCDLVQVRSFDGGSVVRLHMYAGS
jgi:anti-sigma regulatory factor (Ser/Thr protein kinase)